MFSRSPDVFANELVSGGALWGFLRAAQKNSSANKSFFFLKSFYLHVDVLKFSDNGETISIMKLRIEDASRERYPKNPFIIYYPLIR